MPSNKKIKVLETIRQGKIGGGETHVLDLVEELDKNIYEPVVLSFTDGPMIDRLNKMGIKTYVINTERPFDITKWNKVKKLFREEQIDIVHAHGTRANSNTFWAAKQLGLPIIYTVHGWSFHADQQPLIKMYRTFGEKFLISNSNITICVSENNLKDGKEKFNIPKAQVIKNGINLKKFNPNNPFKDVRAELGISKDTVVVGYIARITAQKDPSTLLKAIAKVPDTLDVKFLIVGDGDLKEATLKLAEELRITSKIIFSSFRQDVPDVLSAIDIYCLPSLWEGLPIGLLEAMAMKKAIVATSIDGTKEVITDKVNGLLIPAQAPDQLADAIIKLVTDKEMRNRLGLKAHATIEDQFNVKTMTRKVENLYKECLLNKNR